MGLDWVDYDAKLTANWEVHKDVIYDIKTVAEIPIGKVVTVEGRKYVQFDASMGTGGAYLSDLQQAARDVASEYGDLSKLSRPKQVKIIKSVLDRVKRGQVLDRDEGLGDAAIEGLRGGFAIGFEVFSFGAYDMTAAARQGGPGGEFMPLSTSFKGRDYDTSRAFFKGSRGLLMMALGGHFAGVGHANAFSKVELIRAANSTGGLIYSSGVGYGFFAGMEKYEKGGDFGDVFDSAGKGGLSAGIFAKATGLDTKLGQFKPADWTAGQIHKSGGHPATRNQRVMAVGRSRSGNVYVGSNAGFDRGQREAADRLGVIRVPTHGGMHAEENLVLSVPDLTEVGTARLYPCGPDQHDCQGLLTRGGIKIVNPPPQN